MMKGLAQMSAKLPCGTLLHGVLGSNLPQTPPDGGLFQTLVAEATERTWIRHLKPRPTPNWVRSDTKFFNLTVEATS